MITFTDEDYKLRDTISKMTFYDLRDHMRDLGYTYRSGCYKYAWSRDDKDYIVKAMSIEGRYMRGTPYQTVRAMDGFDASVQMSEEDRANYNKYRTYYREIFGFSRLKKYRVKQYYIGQGKDFIFVVQDKLKLYDHLPYEERRGEGSLIKHRLDELRELIQKDAEEIRKDVTGFHPDLHTGNWGVGKCGGLFVFDGC